MELYYINFVAYGVRIPKEDMPSDVALDFYDK